MNNEEKQAYIELKKLNKAYRKEEIKNTRRNSLLKFNERKKLLLLQNRSIREDLEDNTQSYWLGLRFQANKMEINSLNRQIKNVLENGV